MNINSPDVSVYEYSAVINLTGLPSSSGSPAINAGVPYIQITDTSTPIGSPNPAVKINYSITDPSGNVIYQGDFTSNFIGLGGKLNIPLPMYGGTVAWGSYQINSQLQDSATTVFTYTPTKVINLCKPNGITKWLNSNVNNPNGGGMCISNNIDCLNKQMIVNDSTPYIYNGVAGTLPYNTSLQIAYPPNPFGGSLTPNATSTFLPFSIPLTLNGRYQVYINNYITYNFPMYCSVIIGYSYFNDDVRVQCNVDPCQVVCEYDKLLQEYKKAAADPDNGFKAQENLIIASGLLIKLMSFQSCGIDLGNVLKEIEEIGINCDCLCQTTAISTTSIPGVGGVWSAIAVCGDIQVKLNQIGNNVQLLLQNLSYVVVPAEDGTQNLMVITPTTNGCTKTYTISLQGLQNQLNAIESALLMQGSAIGSLNGSLLALNGSLILFESKFNLNFLPLAPYYVSGVTDLEGYHVGNYTQDIEGNIEFEGSVEMTITSPNANNSVIGSMPVFPTAAIKKSVLCQDATSGVVYPAEMRIFTDGSMSIYANTPSDDVSVVVSFGSLGYNINS